MSMKIGVGRIIRGSAYGFALALALASFLVVLTPPASAMACQDFWCRTAYGCRGVKPTNPPTTCYVARGVGACTEQLWNSLPHCDDPFG